MTQNMNLVLGVNFDLLKTNLAAIYEKTDQKSALLVMPITVNSPNTVKLGEMVDEFKDAFGIEGAEDKIKGNLENVQNEKSPFKWDEIDFQLKAAFLYKEMPGKQTEGTEKASETQSGSGAVSDNGFTEYAFAISVDVSNALPRLGVIEINSLFVAVWNTERTSVLAQMGIGNISRMLQQLDA